MKRSIFTAFGFLIATSVSASPFEAGVSGSKIGDLTESSGLQVGYHVNDRFRVRLGYENFQYDNQRILGSIRFDEQLDQDNLALNVDWFPFKGRGRGFFGTLGAVQGDGDYRLTATPNAATNYFLNGTLYSGAQLGNVTGNIQNADIAPYIGVGYRFDFSRKARTGAFMQLEAGGIFNLDPQLTLTSSNPSSLANLATDLQSAANNEASKLEDSYEIYRLTLGYRF